MLNHSKALVWEGLNLLVHRDAVREGDGPSMISHWKLDMLQFWNRHHNEYFVTGCQFLAGTFEFHFLQSMHFISQSAFYIFFLILNIVDNWMDEQYGVCQLVSNF